MDIPSPVLILAPMRGVTTMHYRQAFTNHFGGLDLEIAPFISTVSAECIKPSLLNDVRPENNSTLPLIPQLIGNHADDFIRMATALHDLGYDEINWNLGCPHKPIRKKRRGSGLLPHPDLIDQLLDQICERSPCQISVKVRLGVAGTDELMSLIPVLNRHPLSEVIIHPRTAEQMYTGTVDLEAFDAAHNEIKHPVCYNGDINDSDFFHLVQKRFPSINRFMLGRGLLANPFLCEIIKGNPPDPSDAITRIQAFHDDLVGHYASTYYGDHPVLGKMKEFWTYQTIHLSNGKKMFKKIKKTERLSTYRKMVDEFLTEAEWNPQMTVLPGE